MSADLTLLFVLSYFGIGVFIGYAIYHRPQQNVFKVYLNKKEGKPLLPKLSSETTDPSSRYMPSVKFGTGGT